MGKKLDLILIGLWVLMIVGATSAVPPVLVWQNTLENDATSTVDGGEIINPPSSYVPGARGNAFAGNGSVYISWDNSEVAAIFDDIWDNDAGSTIDLYFRGDHWDTHSGDSGFWSVTDRYGGNDGYYILSVRDGKLRFPYKDSYTNYSQAPHLTGITLANNVTYRLTVRQHDNNFEVYLDGGAYRNSSPVFTDNTWSETIAFPQYNSGSPGRQMAVGDRAIFGGTLQSGEWVDHVRVYNGYYTPVELDIPYATNPDPGIDEINVSPDVVLDWDAPDPNFIKDLPARYNVYFGTEPNDTHPNFDFTLVSENQLDTLYDPLGEAGLLEEATDYYWRIDVVDPNFGEAKAYTGDLWHFATIPPKATEPYPDDDQTNVAQNVELSWTPGYGAVSHDVYLSTIQSEVENRSIPPINVEVEKYKPPDLNWETEYFWRIVERFDGGGEATGDVWRFTTGTPQCEYELDGDANGDCVVDLRDFAIMAGNWLVCNLTNGYCP